MNSPYTMRYIIISHLLQTHSYQLTNKTVRTANIHAYAVVSSLIARTPNIQDAVSSGRKITVTFNNDL